MTDVRTPCAGRWELFDADDRGDVIEAKRLCGMCPAKTRYECLLRTLRFELRAPVKERHGVCGGLSREERYEIATKGIGYPGARHLQHLALNLPADGCPRCEPVPEEILLPAAVAA